MKNLCLLTSVLLWCMTTVNAQPKSGDTFCNPINLDYRFSLSEGSYREAADPIVVLFKDDYYLFASHSGGYWWSPDFRNWTFVKTTGVDIEKFAPSVWVIGETMYYTSSGAGSIYKTTVPKEGTWEYVSHPYDWDDPWVFVDDDGRVYAYHGCTDGGSIDCVQLDPKNDFAVIGKNVECIPTNSVENGYELAGDDNDGGATWTEGAVMLKHNGTYYLTYATPGTQYRSYCEGYYTSSSPMGPFKLGVNSPSTYKPLGFVTGVGHGGLFYDKSGKLWAIETTTISKKHMFERRLSMFPAEIGEDGLLHANTLFGDYPQYYPGVATDPVTDNSPKWYLISKGGKATASSVLKSNVASNATDEDIRTYWSAVSSDAGEWLMVDMNEICSVNAVQSNFYESETVFANGREKSFTTRYKLECSTNGEKWRTLVDKSHSDKDTPHDYVELSKPVKARYIRITNCGPIAGDGMFALSDLRVFGHKVQKAPATVSAVNVKRGEDRRTAEVSWQSVENADGYIIRYGIAPDKLWNHFQIWSGASTSYRIKSLIRGQNYYFRVDSYNGSGVTKGVKVLSDSEK